MCHMSGVMCHMSGVRCQVSGVSDGASRWRVGYQRGLPHLVLSVLAYFAFLVKKEFSCFATRVFAWKLQQYPD